MKRSRARWWIVLPALVALLAGAPGPSEAQGIALAPGDAAPKLTGYQFSDGRYRDVDWSENELTVVNFWATWCLPCRDEMPRLQMLQDEHGDAGLEIIGVYEAENTWPQVAQFVKPLGLTYPILRARDGVNEGWGGISAYPTTFLVDGGGRILRRYVGALPEQTQGLVDDIEALLDGRSMGPMVVPDRPSGILLPGSAGS